LFCSATFLIYSAATIPSIAAIIDNKILISILLSKQDGIIVSYIITEFGATFQGSFICAFSIASQQSHWVMHIFIQKDLIFSALNILLINLANTKRKEKLKFAVLWNLKNT
jgi:hypothetical protein